MMSAELALLDCSGGPMTAPGMMTATCGPSGCALANSQANRSASSLPLAYTQHSAGSDQSSSVRTRPAVALLWVSVSVEEV